MRVRRSKSSCSVIAFIGLPWKAMLQTQAHKHTRWKNETVLVPPVKEFWNSPNRNAENWSSHSKKLSKSHGFRENAILRHAYVISKLLRLTQHSILRAIRQHQQSNWNTRKTMQIPYEYITWATTLMHFNVSADALGASLRLCELASI